MLFRPYESPVLKTKSLVPTTPKPKITNAIPNHLMYSRVLFRNVTESNPVKTITAPRSIWNDEAYVRLRPTYIVLVANISISAGGRKIKGLKVGLATTRGARSSNSSYS
jgi:hypothetical protein